MASFKPLAKASFYRLKEGSDAEGFQNTEYECYLTTWTEYQLITSSRGSFRRGDTAASGGLEQFNSEIFRIRGRNHGINSGDLILYKGRICTVTSSQNIESKHMSSGNGFTTIRAYRASERLQPRSVITFGDGKFVTAGAGTMLVEGDGVL